MENKIQKIKECEAAIKLFAKNELSFNRTWWNEKDKNRLAAFLICNDTFGYACADCEEIDFLLLPDVWENYRKHGWPSIVNLISNIRNCKPIPEIIKVIKKYKEKEIDDFEIGFKEETKNNPDLMLLCYEKVIDIIVASDNLAFSVKNGEINPILWGEEQEEYFEVEWEKILEVIDIQRYIVENNLRKREFS